MLLNDMYIVGKFMDINKTLLITSVLLLSFLSPAGPGSNGPVWALIGRAPLGPNGLGPNATHWALMGWA